MTTIFLFWFRFGFIAILAFSISSGCFSQSGNPSAQQSRPPAPKSDWPKEITTTGYRIVIYQPQPDSLTGNKLYTRAAVSVSSNDERPVFGAIWVMAVISSDRETRDISLVNAKVLNVRFPNQDSIPKTNIDQFKNLLENEIPKWQITTTMDELTATLKDNLAAVKEASNLKNDPPEIIFTKQPSVLVLFDGIPSFKPVDNSGIKRAVNTPFLVVQDPKDKMFYLYGGDYWFKTNDVVKGTWTNINEPPKDIKKMQEEKQKQAQTKPQNNIPSGSQNPQATGKQQSASKKTGIPQIIVRTAPAELIQSDGEPNFAPIQSTQLLYVTNTDDNIFMTIDKQQYFILISGRWYSSNGLTGPWNFIPSDKLPADFAKIPEGSEKDIVLASVAGTEAAKEAVMDAQIPQTAVVDRKTASCMVKYDGDPKFEQIKGTMLYRAVNTSSSVILSGKTYYVCENAVWFTGNSPTGPWIVATEIPAEIQKIPPEDPAYNVKYVYIYDVQPTVVYMGYLPGYVGCFVYGPTIVYGTGFPYPCWYGPYYYPRPVTWGFSMHYNPWCGWSMGFSVSVGFFHFSVGGSMYAGGWWGPPMYRPPYYVPYNHYYGRGPVYVHNTTINVNNVNVNRNNFNQNNIYSNHRSGVQPVTQPASRQPGSSGTTSGSRQSAGSRTDGSRQPGTNNLRSGTNNQGNVAPKAKNAQNNVYTDRDGNVYRKNGNNWEQNTGKNWQSADNRQATTRSEGTNPGTSAQPSRQSSGFDRQNMDRQNANRNRSSMQNSNRSSFQHNSGGMGGAGGRGGRR